MIGLKCAALQLCDFAAASLIFFSDRNFTVVLRIVSDFPFGFSVIRSSDVHLCNKLNTTHRYSALFAESNKNFLAFGLWAAESVSFFTIDIGSNGDVKCPHFVLFVSICGRHVFVCDHPH